MIRKPLVSVTSLGLLVIVAVVGVFAGSPRVGSEWKDLTVQVAGGSNSPFPRGSFAAAAATKTGKSGWMFGGVIDDFTESPIYNNDLFRIDPSGSKVRFTQMGTDGSAPTARAFPSMAVVRSGSDDDVYVFGGGTFPFNIPFPSDDSFWKFHAATNTWTDLTATGGPAPRLGATLVANEDALYLFGGISFDFEIEFFTLHNDLWKFDIHQGAWTLLSNDAGPAPRHVAMGAILEDDKLLIYGGERIEVEFFPEFSIDFPIDTSTWVWDLTNGGWTQMADGPARNYGAVGSNEDGLILFGGDASGGPTCSGSPFAQNPTNDLFTFNLQNGWTSVLAASPPAPTKRTAGFALRGQFYTFGGFDFTCESGQIWNSSVHSIKFQD